MSLITCFMSLKAMREKEVEEGELPGAQLQLQKQIQQKREICSVIADMVADRKAKEVAKSYVFSLRRRRKVPERFQVLYEALKEEIYLEIKDDLPEGTLWANAVREAYRQVMEKATPEERAEVEKPLDYDTIYQETYDKEYREVYAKTIKKFREYERDWEQYKETLKDTFPLFMALTGGLNYAMTLDEIKEIVKEKFVTMNHKRLVISRDEYERSKDKFFDFPRLNLTRIWGAQYLKKSIDEGGVKGYNTPGYVIVTDNPEAIRIKVSFDSDMAPVIDSLEDRKAFIVFEKIEGSPVGDSSDLLRRFEYVDLGPEMRKRYNVLEKKGTGIRYVVDTDPGSFKYEAYTEGRLAEDSFAYYAFKKFRHLNNLRRINIMVDVEGEKAYIESERDLSVIAPVRCIGEGI